MNWPVLDGLAKIFFHGGAGIDGRLQGGCEEADGVAAGGLGLIHGDVGLLQDIVAEFSLASPNTEMPMLALLTAVVAVQHVGLGTVARSFSPIDLACAAASSGISLRSSSMSNELVAAEPAHGIGLADAGGEAPADFLQQQIAGLVAERVVQGLEVVEVDEEQAHDAVGCGALAARAWRSRSSSRRRLGSPVSGS